MRPEDILNNAIASIKSGIDTVENKYDEHIKEKAVEEVNKKIDEKGLKKEQILDEDYEAMVSDLSKDIKNDYILIDFQGIGYVEVPKSHAPYIELGYAITCHSAQGSQFDTVIGGIDFSMFIMLNKELLYTMITRASKKFILCAQTKALQYAITKEQIIHRQTYLMDDLDELCNKKFDF